MARDFPEERLEGVKLRNHQEPNKPTVFANRAANRFMVPAIQDDAQGCQPDKWLFRVPTSVGLS